MINSYQTRQMLLLKQLVFNYKTTKISLNNFIAKIEELLDVLEGIDEVWCTQMKNLWLTLEIINAMKLSTQNLHFTEVEINKINETIFAMQELINKKIVLITTD